MGGGKSSSSSSQSTQQIDKRIAASENAVVLQEVSGNTFTMTDSGAITAARDVSLAGLDLAEANLDDLYEFGGRLVDLMKSDHTATLDTLNKNSAQAFQFVDKATQDANARAFNNIAPWLVVSVSVVAISYLWRNNK